MKTNSTPLLSRWEYARNWLSLSGLVIAFASLFSFFLLFILDWMAAFNNPYLAVLTYLAAPAFFVGGVALAVVGAAIQHRRVLRAVSAGAKADLLLIDLTRPHDQRLLIGFGVGVSVFLLVAAMGSYYSYRFTESVQFCGQVCHTVMNPELTTYRNSPHARVPCVECHVGPGATSFVKAKLNGLHQVYAVTFNTYARPIPVPVENLRPARWTCEHCHWPRKHIGNLDRLNRHYLSDEKNTPFAVRLRLKVGGGDPTQRRVGGIHWHVSASHRVEYIATDKARQVIPWVRVIDPGGVVREFRAPGFKDSPKPSSIRTMDCIDCHNRPSHDYQRPSAAVDRAIALGKIDRKLPFIKKRAVAVLAQPYATEQEALTKIAAALAAQYPNVPQIQPVIGHVQLIYRQNFFPEMKADWRSYPNNIGHKNWPGCFRCHDGLHTTADKKHTIKAQDCNACHLILSQGTGKQLDQFDRRGQPFAHPGGDVGDMKCYECHANEPM